MDEKQCNSCKQNKPLNKFGNNKTKSDGKQKSCKECLRNQSIKSYNKDKVRYYNRIKSNNKRIKDWYHEYRQTLVCSVCPETRWWVLEWHHLDMSQKDFNIGDMTSNGYGIDTILGEINKCIVVCSNCHRDIHHNMKTIMEI